jgi:hypothetical protein
MIADSFGPRTFANMEVTLETACNVLGIASERHQARRHIASKIVECAKSGDGRSAFCCQRTTLSSGSLAECRDRGIWLP